MKPHRLLALAACVSVVLVSGCVRGVNDDASDTVPEGSVPDNVLFDQIADLPDVVSTDLQFQNPFGNGPSYAGRITVDANADALCVLDEALSILHQGRPDVRLGVLVDGTGTTYGLLSLVGRDGSAEERYGPQPTEPQPTATVRACTPPDTGTSADATETPTP